MKTTVAITAAVAVTIAWLAVHHFSQRATPARSRDLAWRNSAVAAPKPRLPAPRLPAPPPPAESTADSAPTTNLFTRLLNGETPRLSAEQVEPYLQKNHRSVESLLAAFNATGERAFLREAMEKHPDDPRVGFAAYFRAGPYDSTQPASPERRQWLDAFVKSAPENALPNYLAALDSFRAGQSDQAVQQLLAASQKSQFQDYSLDFMQNAEEAYRAGGYSDTEAKAVASSTLVLPHLVDLKQTGEKLVELAALYRQAGDATSAQAAEQMGLVLGQRLSESGQLSFINELVGNAIQRKILATMDPNSTFGSAGQTVQSQLDALNQQRDAIKALGAKASEILPTLADQDRTSYFERLKLFGEGAATQWLIKTHGVQPAP